jgi:hypothetical protein
MSMLRTLFLGQFDTSITGGAGAATACFLALGAGFDALAASTTVGLVSGFFGKAGCAAGFDFGSGFLGAKAFLTGLAIFFGAGFLATGFLTAAFLAVAFFGAGFLEAFFAAGLVLAGLDADFTFFPGLFFAARALVGFALADFFFLAAIKN